MYAALALVAAVVRAELDLQHRWIGRRAGIRMRSELMAVIYDKALKRKDFAGVVDKKKGDNKKEEAEEERTSADVGKIVNMMSNDTNEISYLTWTMNMFYSSLIEIAIASFYLYQLLGWSTFVGFLALSPSWPINGYLMKWAFSIQKSLLNARDKRMGVLNELITAIKFIKFFAWGMHFFFAFLRLPSIANCHRGSLG
jgi:ABC-type multidrug transport system fused ATPase/permease subunit